MRFSTLLIKNLFRRKTRSLLTIFGIAIAVGTTVALLGIANGFRQTSIDSISDRGADLVVTEQGCVDQLSSDLDERVLDSVLQIPGVNDVAPTLTELAMMPAQGTTINVLMQGWIPASFLFDALKMVDGRSLRSGDQGVTIIGSLLAKQLEKGVGDQIDIQGELFEVVGVYHSFVLVETSGLFINLKEMQRINFREGRMTGFAVKLDRQSADIEEIKSQIDRVQLPNGQNARLFSQTARDYTDDAMHIKASQAMAWLTSAIAVFVGTIGILNTMVMSVVERLREISILRAIGWKKSRIAVMVLGESLMISIVGAFVGIAGAWLTLKWLTLLPFTQSVIDGKIALHVIAFGLAMALLVGFVGGWLPAIRAANLPPSHGLRSD